jgi:NAD-dependent SIR2 family protein deacetylase
LVKKWYPEYYSMGFKTIFDIQKKYWRIKDAKAEKYWGFWAQHIYHIRYESQVTKPYIELNQLFNKKKYFIITTNADSQIEKAGFPSEKIFSTQGNYCYFQCSNPCSEEIYYNEKMIDTMVRTMPDHFEIRTEDIPVCPKCGALMIPNLRCDNNFVEKPHMEKLTEYLKFIQENQNSRIVFMELGVGYATPGIIRYPFEKMAQMIDSAMFIRINQNDADIPYTLKKKSISIKADLAKALNDINKGCV